jgi:hypothetical protein
VKTTRVIRAVQILAGDKDRASFRQGGGTLTQDRSRGSTEEHEHCAPNMPMQARTIKCGTFASAPVGTVAAGVLSDTDMNNNRNL